MKTKRAMMLCGLILAAGCPKAKIDPDDNSKPTVQIKVQGSGGGEFLEMSETTLSVGGSLKLMCVVNDPQGVKSASLSFNGQSDGCHVKGTSYTGGFAIEAMPETMTQNLLGDDQGNVITNLPLITDLKGPFTCLVHSPPCTHGDACKSGSPYGGVITVTCNGKNWSGDSQTQENITTLKVTLH